MTARILSSLLLIPIVLGCLYQGGLFTLILVALMATIMYGETCNMFKLPTIYYVIGIMLQAVFFLGLYFLPVIPEFLSSAIACILAFFLSTIALIELSKRSLIHPSYASLISIRFAFLFSFMMAYLYLIRHSPNGLALILFLLITIWLCDTAAYVIGKAIGKHPLTRLSPKKTIEGSIGAIAFSVLFSLFFGTFFGITTFTARLLLPICIAIVAQYGDIHESLMKRLCNKKDASQLIPGHGGVYDRCDSYIFILPLYYFLIEIL